MALEQEPLLYVFQRKVGIKQYACDLYPCRKKNWFKLLWAL